MSSEPARDDHEARHRDSPGDETRVGEIAIEARRLTKVYEVYRRPQDRLIRMLWSRGRKRFEEVVAVRDIDLTVRRGETLGIVGRNGSGKSTLLQMISGTLEPTSGELDVVGHIAPLLALGIGFDPEFTGRDNVFVNGAILGLSGEEMALRLDSIRRFADIGDFFDRPVKTYSSGMYSRLAFAVAINADPDILVIDEALAVGDEAFIRKCFARIEEIKENGSTILFVSHSPNTVVELCDRALLIDGGERLLTADPKTVISRYQRLLYASEESASAIREEILALDRDPASSSGPPLASSASLEIAAPTDPPEFEDHGSYDENLKPESTVEYERNGAVIENPRILAPDGRQVNVLRVGRSYTYTYDVTFLEAAFGVRFGMLVKLPTGFALGGQLTHLRGEGMDYAEAGSTARVSFPFNTVMLPGAYFLNAGVVGFRDGAEIFLHRVLDAAMFRVEVEESGRVVGHVSFEGVRAAEVELLTPGDGES